MSGSQQLLLGGSVQQAVDPYFYSVTSLLHGDGTNGGQNNTFLDSSTNNFTITRNGNTTQGSFSPFSQTGWSNYFDGSGDYLSGPTNNAVSTFTGDFTIESWCYFNSIAADNTVVACVEAGPPELGWNFRWRQAGAGFRFYSSAVGTFDFAYTPSVGQWFHVAISRSGTSLRCFVNGTQIGTTQTASGTVSRSTVNPLTVGGGPYAATSTNGYLSNVRIVNGTAVYTADFTPSTTPLTAITNTSLLTCQANRFLDASSNNFTITRNGDVSVQPFSPFNPTTPYSTSAVGGSGYFDGSGDYLSWTGTALGSGNFTTECWVYFNPYSTANYAIIGSAAANTSAGWELFLEGATSTIKVYSGGVVVLASSTVTARQWYHLAFVRNGSTVTLYINGVSVSTATLTANLSNTTMYVSYDFAAQVMAGYVSGVRHVVGTAVYTAGFTPPTAPPTAITSTSALLNFTNGAIFDNAAVADYETVGNAQISTSVKKYGTGSMYFDGSGDYLTTPYSQSINFGTGDFTIEGWFYLNSFANQYYVLGGTWSSATSDEWLIQIENNGSLRFLTTANTSFFATGLIKTGTWYHFAASRNAGVIKAYINGSVFATITNANSIGSVSKTLNIGQQPGGSWPWNGYLDDWRVTKGIGRYPYNFTPPTAEFPNIGGTVTLTADPYFDYTTLLLPGNGTNGAQNNTFLDSSTNAFSITRNGNTTQGTFSPFSQTGWGNYFDGATATRLTMPSNAAFAFGTGAYTVEGWVYLNAQAASQSTFFEAGTASGAFSTSILSTGAVSLGTYGVGAVFSSPSNSVTPNQWFHIAIVRNSTASNDTKIYVNGTAVATGTDSSNWTVTTTPGIGGLGLSGYTLNGYISNLRVVKGTAVYTADFTPSTTPLTAITNTSLLTCQSNRFRDASTNNFTITRNGDVSVQAFSPFNPTAAWSAATYGGSGYFDGSGDYLTVASNAAFGYGTGDFTIEMWIYPTVIQGASTPNIFDQRTANPQVVPTLYINNGQLIYYVNGLNRITGATLVAGQWYHLAVCRASGSTRMFVNGVQSGSTYTDANNYVTSPITIFTQGPAAAIYQAGYCGDLRVVKGTALYTAPFTPPTAPLTAISGTSLLLNYTNAGIFDATSKNDLETVGNAQISTAQSKFGGSSMLFDGTGDWLQGRNTRLLDIGSGDFTIEGWLYPTTSGTTRAIVAQFNTNGTGPGWTSYLKTTNVIEFYGGSGTITVTGTGAVSANAWSHFAICRYGSTITIYVNGIAGGTGTNSSFSDDTTGPVEVGARGGAGAIPFTGYIDDLRITKGIARYISNFTPPTTAFLTQ